MELCRTFLSLDQRNFHCWCYRRFVVDIGTVPSAAEFAYSTEKIEENFSNYSAFHHRSVFIRKLTEVDVGNGYGGRGDLSTLDIASSLIDLVDGEFAITENAVYTEPDDQSAWWYHQFLLSWCKQLQDRVVNSRTDSTLPRTITPGTLEEIENISITDTGITEGWFTNVLEHQIEVVRGLLAVEPDSKWALLSLAMMASLLLEAHSHSLLLDEKEGIASKNGDIKSNTNTSTNISTSTPTPSLLESLRLERVTLLERLCEVDPMHTNRYIYLQRNTSNK